MAKIQRPYGFTAPTNPLPPKSKTLLLSLTSTSTTSLATTRPRSATVNPEEKVIPYHYFGTRLVDLYEELANPTLRGVEKCISHLSSLHIRLLTDDKIKVYTDKPRHHQAAKNTANFTHHKSHHHVTGFLVPSPLINIPHPSIPSPLAICLLLLNSFSGMVLNSQVHSVGLSALTSSPVQVSQLWAYSSSSNQTPHGPSFERSHRNGRDSAELVDLGKGPKERPQLEVA
ncbi:hypothetical protein V8E54_008570 [Elaphomyces granulatus]